ncbi:MAG: class I SAM-dependent methyltransferase, partial [Planctomycetes bacterium]|nr:class I SAM-dependent methyltransferase [Planctomycetota bacterium]
MFNLDRRSYTRRYLDKKIDEECKNLKGMVLDIGGGETDYTGYFGKEAKVISMDINPDAGPKVVCDATRPLPFMDNSFDYAFSMNVIEHIKDPDTYLKESQRVLKTGGIFFM